MPRKGGEVDAPAELEEIKKAQKLLRNLTRQQKKAGGIPAAEIGCPPGYTRTTVIFNKDQYQRLKNLAYWQRRNIYNLVEDALDPYLNKFNESKKTAPNVHRLYNVPAGGGGGRKK